MKEHGLFRLVTGLALMFAATFALCAATHLDTVQQAAFPEIFVVNSTGDGADAFPGDGQCETAVGNGVCTLRAAIEEANAHAGGDGISFSIPTTDPGYSNGIWTITPNGLSVSDSVNITGPGADKLIIWKVTSQQAPILNVTTSGTVNISSLTLGSLFGQEPSSGSGIQNSNSGTVNVTSCRFINSLVSSSSTTTPAKGGGIYNNSGTVHVTSSTFSFNRADSPNTDQSRGAGLYNNTGTVSVVNSTFNNNSADTGGGIFNENRVVSVTGCTFHDNGAAFWGGGITSFGGTVNITNSTFYANVAYSRQTSGIFGVGGGIAIYNCTLNLTNSTVTANFSGAGGSGVSNGLGSDAGVVNVKSTIIASNYGGVSIFAAAPDVSGAFNSSGFNLIGKKDGSTGFTAATDKKGTIVSPLNPKLDVKGLRDNGGPTQTVALIAGSPAIDKGTSIGLTGTLTTDQRGFARTVNNSGIPNATGGDGTDIGAYEFGAH